MSKRRKSQKAEAAQSGALHLVVVGLVFTVLVGVALTGWRQLRAAKAVPSAPSMSGLTSLSGLPALTPDQRQSFDIAQANLLCAQGLNGAQDLDLGQCLATLDAWAKHVAAETARNFHQFQTKPQEFRHSEGYFRMLLLVTVLQQDFGVRYNPARNSTPERLEPDSVFFADSQDLFLHGILGPRRLGTCVSMPVLYVAVGRRLGYPLKLVTAKGHLFARWEGAERFNIEGTNEGLTCHADDHYRTWPYPLSAAEQASGHYLKSLTPKEERALFLSTRGQCLLHNGRLAEAREVFGQAVQLAPHWPEHVWMLARTSPGSGNDGMAASGPPFLSREARAALDAQAQYAENLNRQNREMMAARAKAAAPVCSVQPGRPKQPR